MRRLSVGGPCDRMALGAFLSSRHPQVEVGFWRAAAARGELFLDRHPVVDFTQTVRAGQQLTHHYLEQGEPLVETEIELLHDDAEILVVSKPAPLPVHPCGRFNRHSLTFLVSQMFPAWKVRPVHRLDADTTGVLVLAKTKRAARSLAEQFEKRGVNKMYLAGVSGVPGWQEKKLAHHIGVRRAAHGTRSVRADHFDGGQVAECWARVLGQHSGDAVLQLEPSTGRTHQLRLQLAEIGHPILHDPLYGPDVAKLTTHASAAKRTGVAKLTQTLRLHAWKLSFQHPSELKRVHFEAAPPGWAQPTR